MSAHLEDDAARQLETAGFFVQRHVRQTTVGKHEAVIDVVAWAGTPNGELAPDLIVEVKAHRDDASRAAAARQLGYYVPLVDAARAYLFDGSWHLVTEGFSTTVPVDCPRPGVPADDAVAPLSLITSLIWNELNKLRNAAPPDGAWRALLLRLSNPPGDGLDPRLHRMTKNATNRARIGQALASLLDRFDQRSPIAEHVTPPALAEALVRLLAPEPGALVLDPFCGLGRVLAAVHTATDGNCKLLGTDIHAETAENSRRLLALAGIDAEVTVGDSLRAPLDWSADAVVTNPPMGIRLSEPVQLQMGGLTREGTVAAIDQVLGALRDGGRAVLLVAPGVLSAGGTTEEFRAALAAKVRVVSIIQLPPQLLPYTALPCAVLVLEKTKPTETLAARLEGDWERQLSDDGDFMRDYRAHLGARS